MEIDLNRRVFINLQIIRSENLQELFETRLERRKPLLEDQAVLERSSKSLSRQDETEEKSFPLRKGNLARISKNISKLDGKEENP